jgi:hypothetical protein
LSRLPTASHRVAQVEAFNGVREIAHEISPPQLAVRENVETQFLLLCEHAENVFVLERVKPRGILSVCFARGEQVCWSQKTSNVVGFVRRWHSFVPPQEVAETENYD